MSCCLNPKMTELVGDPVSPFPMQEQLLLIVNGMQGAADQMRAQSRAEMPQPTSSGYLAIPRLYDRQFLLLPEPGKETCAAQSLSVLGRYRGFHRSNVLASALWEAGDSVPFMGPGKCCQVRVLQRDHPLLLMGL